MSRLLAAGMKQEICCEKPLRNSLPQPLQRPWIRVREGVSTALNVIVLFHPASTMIVLSNSTIMIVLSHSTSTVDIKLSNRTVYK